MKFKSQEHLEHLKRAAKLGGLAKSKNRRQVIERFMERIQKNSEGCWIWTGLKSRGYGTFKINGKAVKATRWAYEFFKKEKIESSKIFVCHKCDVRSCVNPEHLFLGTHNDNMLDAKKKGRFKSGRSHPNYKNGNRMLQQ